MSEQFFHRRNGIAIICAIMIICTFLVIILRPIESKTEGAHAAIVISILWAIPSFLFYKLVMIYKKDMAKIVPLAASTTAASMLELMKDFPATEAAPAAARATTKLLSSAARATPDEAHNAGEQAAAETTAAATRLQLPFLPEPNPEKLLSPMQLTMQELTHETPQHKHTEDVADLAAVDHITHQISHSTPSQLPTLMEQVVKAKLKHRGDNKLSIEERIKMEKLRRAEEDQRIRDAAPPRTVLEEIRRIKPRASEFEDDNEMAI